MHPPPHPPPRLPSLADLLAQSALGDEPAFARFYDDTAPRVYGLILRVVRDPAMAERVTREVFLHAWLNAGHFDTESGSAASWLLASAHRSAVDSVRAAESGEPAYDAQVSRPIAGLVAEPVEVTADSLRVSVALGALDPGQREVVELAYFGGYTHAEVEALIGAGADAGPGLILAGLIQLRALIDEVA